MVAKHVNKKNAGKPRVWRLMLFYTHVLLLLQPSVLWLSIATFNNDAKPPPKWILLEFDVFRIRRRLGGLPYISCKRDPSKMRDYMDRRVTSPKRVTSPTWGPPTPCKQVLNIHNPWTLLWMIYLHIFWPRWFYRHVDQSGFKMPCKYTRLV